MVARTSWGGWQLTPGVTWGWRPLKPSYAAIIKCASQKGACTTLLTPTTRGPRHGAGRCGGITPTEVRHEVAKPGPPVITQKASGSRQRPPCRPILGSEADDAGPRLPRWRRWPPPPSSRAPALGKWRTIHSRAPLWPCAAAFFHHSSAERLSRFTSSPVKYAWPTCKRKTRGVTRAPLDRDDVPLSTRTSLSPDRTDPPPT